MSNEDKIQEIIEFEKEFEKEEKEILILTSESSSCVMVGKFYHVNIKIKQEDPDFSIASRG